MNEWNWRGLARVSNLSKVTHRVTLCQALVLIPNPMHDKLRSYCLLSCVCISGRDLGGEGRDTGQTGESTEGFVGLFLHKCWDAAWVKVKLKTMTRNSESGAVRRWRIQTEEDAVKHCWIREPSEQRPKSILARGTEPAPKYHAISHKGMWVYASGSFAY